MDEHHAKVTNPLSEFFRGFRYPVSALKYLSQHNLWSTAKYPIVLNILILVAIVSGAVWILWPYVSSLTSIITSALGDWSWFAWLGAFLAQVINFAIWVLLFPASLVLGFFTLVLIGQAVASPFLDALSQKVETIEIASVEAPLTTSAVLRSLWIALNDLFWGLIVLTLTHIPLFLVGLVPGIGTIVTGIGSFLVTSWLLAHEFVGLPLSRREMSYWGRWNVVWRYRWRTLGLGAAAALLLWVPGVNLVLLPLATVGGTLLFCELVEGRGDALKAFSSQEGCATPPTGQ